MLRIQNECCVLKLIQSGVSCVGGDAGDAVCCVGGDACDAVCCVVFDLAFEMHVGIICFACFVWCDVADAMRSAVKFYLREPCYCLHT